VGPPRARIHILSGLKAPMKRRITGAIIQGGRIYKAGDEDALASVLSSENIQRLIDKGGELSGDWAVQPAKEEAPAEPPARAPEKPRAKPPTRKGK